MARQTFVLEPGQPSGDLESQVLALRDAATTFRDAMRTDREWDRAKRAYLGAIYSDVDMPAWKARGVNPKILEAVLTLLPTLTSQQPKFHPRARSDGALPVAGVFEAAVDYEWERQRLRKIVTAWLKTAMILGTNFLYTGVYAGIRRHDDDFFTRLFSPYHVLPNPSATDESDLGYVFLQHRLSRSDMLATFGPELGAKLVADCRPSTQFRDDSAWRRPIYGKGTREGEFATSGRAGATNTSEMLSAQTGRDAPDTRWLVEELWMDDDGTSEIDTALADGSTATVRLGSPKGRRIFLVEDKLYPELDTGERGNPFGHGQVPIARLTFDDLQGEFYGQSYVNPLIDQAEQISDVVNQVLNCVRLTLNPVWTVPFESQVDVENFYAYPGMIIPFRHPFKPEVMPPPALPAYVFQILQNLEKDWDRFTGLQDISRGAYEGSLDRTSGKAVQLLQQPKNERVRDFASNMEMGLSRWGYQTMCNAVQFWPAERWARILPDDLKALAPRLPWLQRDPETGERAKYDYDLLPDMTMETGSSLPKDENSRNALAFSLAEHGCFGPVGSPIAGKVLLDAVDYPKRAQIETAVQSWMASQGPPPPHAVDADKLINALANAAKAGLPLTEAQIEAAMAQASLPVPQEHLPHITANAHRPGGDSTPSPSFGGGNKALGAPPSAASQLHVMASPSGQEVPS